MVLTLLKKYQVIFFKIPTGISAFLGKCFASENVAIFLDNYETKIKSSSPQSIKYLRNFEANLAAQAQYSFQQEEHDKPEVLTSSNKGKLIKIVLK